MNKAEIRSIQTTRRDALSGKELMALNEGLLHQFAALDFTALKTVHVFLPIAEKKEPDTFMLIRWLQTHHPDIQIIVPRADFKTTLMTHHLYTAEDLLRKNLFNIPEPVQDEEHAGEIDLVIIPLLAFDDRGYRVGYGKGFYDRFLSGLNCIKAGLSFFESVGTISDTHSNDIRLDLCITPTETIYFNPQASSSSSTGQ
jgi:5-formyltetrahydrofolate cyclo-ligase